MQESRAFNFKEKANCSKCPLSYVGPTQFRGVEAGRSIPHVSGSGQRTNASARASLGLKSASVRSSR